MTFSNSFVPLSEDERLLLSSPRELYLTAGEQHNWDEVTAIGPGERRTISLDIRIGAGAKGEMVRVFEVPQGSKLTILHHVRVEERGSWQNVICIRGRGEVHIRRAIEVFGQGANVALTCLGRMQESSRISVADEIFSHAPNTNNNLCTKIVLEDSSKSEVRGRILVDEHSGGSASFESLDHLLIGEQATAAAIPELEVKTDSITCGHGATTTRPDPEQMFYLRTRGLSQATALRVMAKGFLRTGLNSLSEQTINQALGVMLD